nr:insulinase family protein [uncultured Sphingomonas sp.]
MFQFVSARNLLLSATAALALASPFLAATQAPAKVNGWNVPLTDVPQDPDLILGTLPNGMKYAIRHNETPKGTASMRLQFAFGSLGEADDERGLAHFIEHMAFNGTTHVAEGDMVKILQREGLRFGPDTNAMTGFDSTVYMLDLPVTDKRRLDTGFLLMREIASEILFDPGSVDRERGVIIGERRSRESYQLGQLEDELRFQLPNTPYARRIPIGTLPVLQTASAARLKSLYQRYYRPENATFIFVGDADPKDIEARIKAGFASWRGVGPAGAPIVRGSADFARPQGIDTFRNANVPTSFDLTVLRPWDDPADTQAERRKTLVEAVGNAVLNRRLTRIANADGSPLLSGGTGGGGWRNVALGQSVEVKAKDGAWKAAAATAEQELRRALQYGFTDAEVAREKSNLSASIRNAAESQETRTNQSLAATVIATIDDQDFMTRPDWRLKFWQTVEPTITAAEVNAAFRNQWKGSAPLIHVRDKQIIANADIAATVADSAKVTVSAPATSDAIKFAYDDFGPAGKVMEDRTIADLGIRTVRFANGVRLNMKKTDFEKGRVRFSVRLGGGQLALPQDQPGLNILMSTLYAMGGTGKQSFEDLKEALAGRLVGVGAQVSDDAIVTQGATSPEDLGIQLKAAAAYLTDAGFRDEAGNRWANMVPVLDKQLRSQPSVYLKTKARATLMGDDYRFGVPDADVLSRRSTAEARAAMAGIERTAPIEIGLVGDLDETKAIAAVASSFGALPARSEKAPEVAGARTVKMAQFAGVQTLRHSGSADQAVVAITWPTTDDADYRREAAMTMLSSVMDLMLTETLREKLGATYGADVSSSMSDVFPGFGVFEVSSVIAPGDFGKVEAAILETAKELRDKPVDADLFARARNPLMESIDRSLRDNGYWMAYVGEAQSRADRIQRIRDRRAVYEAISPKELQQLAQTYLTDSQMRVMKIVSDKWKEAPAAQPTSAR